ncbi:MAG: aminopeptidase P family N-terminal domain-containing protein, partial [Pseudorhodoplanes sp.]
MREQAIGRLKIVMKESGLDAIVVISPENYAYVSGFVVPTQ